MRYRTRRSHILPALGVAGLIVGASAVGAGASFIHWPSPAQASAPAKHCDIKGNINARGERIYHMPGQEYYSRTVISRWKGERWFCSEAEARAAGWRKSKL